MRFLNLNLDCLLLIRLRDNLCSRVFSVLFSIVITSLWEEREKELVYVLIVNLFVILHALISVLFLFLLVSGVGSACDCNFVTLRPATVRISPRHDITHKVNLMAQPSSSAAEDKQKGDGQHVLVSYCHGEMSVLW